MIREGVFAIREHGDMGGAMDAKRSRAQPRLDFRFRMRGPKPSSRKGGIAGTKTGPTLGHVQLRHVCAELISTGRIRI